MANIRLALVEILSEIFENLLIVEEDRTYDKPLFNPTADSEADLRAVSLTCRAFHNTIEPIIWRHVYLGKQIRSDVLTPWPVGPSAQKYINLLKLWHSRPDLASHVQTLCLPCPSLKKKPCLLGDEDVAFLRRVAQDLGLRTRNESWRNIPGNTGIVAGLAILLARRAKVLDLPTDSTAFFDYIAASKDIHLRLVALHRIRWRPSRPVTLTDVAPLLRLAPNIKRFDSLPAVCGKETLDCIDWGGFMSISLIGSQLSDSELVGIIKKCRQLQEFTLLPVPTVDPIRILTALKVHASSLRKLNIDFGSYEDSVTGMGSLANFTALKDLALTLHETGIGEHCVLRMLPPNLIRLHLGDEVDKQQEDIKALAKQIKDGGYPKLREVQLAEWDCNGDHPGFCRALLVHGRSIPHDDSVSDQVTVGCDDGQTVLRLQALLEDAGVKCTISKIASRWLMKGLAVSSHQ